MDVQEQLKLEKRVFKFVSARTGKKLDQLGMETRLYHDLNVDGMDAYLIMMDFCTEFGMGYLSLSSNSFKLDRQAFPDLSTRAYEKREE